VGAARRTPRPEGRRVVIGLPDTLLRRAPPRERFLNFLRKSWLPVGPLGGFNTAAIDPRARPLLWRDRRSNPHGRPQIRHDVATDDSTMQPRPLLVERVVGLGW